MSMSDIENLHGFGGLAAGWSIGGAMGGIAVWMWIIKGLSLGIYLWCGGGLIFLCGLAYYLGKTKGIASE